MVSGLTLLRSMAVFISQTAAAHLSDLQVQHSCPEGRSLGVDFRYAGTAFTVIAVYAPSTAAYRPHFYPQCLLSHHPTDRNLILEGDWNCISSELDILDPASSATSRLPGYWDGMRHVEAACQLCNVWRQRYLAGPSLTHISRSSGTASRLDSWLV